MKRSQLKSPLGSPAMQQTVRAKQKKGAGGEGTASGSGESCRCYFRSGDAVVFSGR